MLRIIFLLTFGSILYRRYAELAHEYKRKRIGIGILGAGIFLAFYVLISVTLAVIIALNWSFTTANVGMVLLFEAASMGMAFVIAWIVCRMLRKSWSVKKSSETSGLLDNIE